MKAKGRTVLQCDAKFGTVRLQRHGRQGYSTQIWAPDLGNWAPIEWFDYLRKAEAAFKRSIERLGGEISNQKEAA